MLHETSYETIHSAQALTNDSTEQNQGGTDKNSPWKVSFSDDSYCSINPKKASSVSFLSTLVLVVPTALTGLPCETAFAQNVVEVSINSSVRKELIDEVLTEIKAFKSYEDGWAGAGSIAPSKKAFSDAEKFVYKHFCNLLHKPHLSIATDGELNFWWDLKGVIELDLGFDGDGYYSFYATFGDEAECFGDDIPSDTLLPKKVLNHLFVK